MSLLKPFAIGDIIKWVVLGIVGIMLLIAFIAFSWQFFVPMLMVGAIGIFILLSGVWKTAPFYQVMLFMFLAFFGTWAIQRISVYQMNTFGFIDEPAEVVGGLIGAFLVGTLLVAILAVQVGKKRR